MSQLYFKVASDWEEVVRLRNEIEKLKSELKSMDSASTPQAFNTLNTKLQESTQRMNEMVHEAAQAGAEMELGFKKKIFDASQEVNSFTEKIIEQKAIVRDVQADVRKLGEAYRDAVRNSKSDKATNDTLAEYKAAKRALEEEKTALFALTQEQAKARLSVKQLRDEYSAFKNEGDGVKNSVNDIAGSMKGWIAGIAGGVGVKEFIGKMIEVRGQFQAADTAIQTLLGSKEKADKLMSQVREYAKISPLEFSDVTAATQMMLGFNIEAEKVPKFLAAIGDVSMGDTQKFNSLTLAFSQMSAAGKLMGQDLNQMINAGFNPLQQIAQTTGKSIAQLKDEMSKGAISAEMVQQAFVDATSAGGKFYNMSENASKTIQGQISMLQDAVDFAFNEMGQASEGFIMGAIQGTTALVKNYEKIGKIIAGLVVTYGVYKAAVITNITLTHGWAVAARADAVAKGIQTVATNAATIATKALNAAMKANPYVLVATLITGLVTTVWALHDSTTAAEAAQNSMNKAEEEATKREEEHKRWIDSLIATATDEASSTKEREESMNSLIKRYPSIIQKYIDEEGHLKNILGLKREIAEMDGKQKTTNLKKDYENDKERLGFLKKIQGMDVEERNKFLHGSGSEDNLKWYKSLMENALKGHKGRSALTIDELVDFYSNRTESKRKKYGRNITEKKIEDFSNNLGGKSTDELKALELELKKASKNKKDSTSVFVKSVGDYLTGEDRSALLTKVSGMITARAKKEKSNSNKTKSELEEEKKELKKKKDSLTSKGAAGKKGKEIQDKIDSIDEALKPFDTTGKADKKAEQERKKREREEAKKKREEEKRNKAENKLDSETLKLQMENRQAQLDLEEETTDKKLKLIDLSYDKQKAEIAKKEQELAEQNKKAGTKGLNANGLTSEQQTEIDKANELNEKSRKKQETEVYKEELTAMRDYLKEYGTFQQQKLAIAEEYAEKIKKAQSEGEKLSLEKERNKALQDSADKRILGRVDWVTSFGELGNVGNAFDGLIKNALSQLDEYLKTNDFKNRNADEQKTILDARSQLQESVSNDATFEKLNKQIAEYGARLENLSNLENAHALAIKSRVDAEEERNRIEDKSSKEYEEANKKVIQAKQLEKSTSESLISAENEVANAQNGVADTASKLQSNLDNFASGLNKLTSGTLSGTIKGLEELFKSLGMSDEIMQKFKDTLEKGLSAIFGPMIGGLLANSLDLVEAFITGDLQAAIISAVLGMIDNILYNLLNGGLIVKPMKAVMNGLRGIMDTLVKGFTFGAVDFINWSGSNAKEVAETTERLTNSNERLKSSVDALKDELGDTGGWRAIDAAEQAMNDQRQINEQTAEILRTQMGYHSAHHSNAYYWNLNQNDYASLNQSLLDYNRKQGKDDSEASRVSSLEDILKLTPEELDYIRTYNIDMWEKMISQGKYDKSEYWEALADLAGQFDEIAEKLKETLTQTSFSSLRDSFISSLMDMNKSAKDFSDDFSNYMMQAILNARISDLLDKDLKDFYEKWAEYSKSDNELDEKELAELKSMWDGITNKGMEIRDQVADITGYDNTSAAEQTASGKGFQAMSQDTGEELNGRFTAMYESDLRREGLMSQQSIPLTAINGNVVSLFDKVNSIGNIADETRTILANSYLELQGIRENTGAIIKPIQIMQKDIAEVKQNTSRL